MNRKSMFLLIFFSVVIFSGCTFNATTEGKLSNLLRDLQEIETIAHDRQVELKELEQTEQKLFNEMMTLSQADTNKVSEKLSALQQTLEKRTRKIEEEAEAMAQVNALLSEIESIEESANLIEVAGIESLKQAMQYRHDMHTNFVDAYEELTNLQKGLYELFQRRETDIKKLDQHVAIINEKSQTVTHAVEKFNEATIELNKTRDELYDGFKNEKQE